MVCCFICGLPLVGVNSYTYEPFGTSCTIDWDDDSPLSFAYVYLLVVVAYTLPVGTMSYCYTKVIRSWDEYMSGGVFDKCAQG